MERVRKRVRRREGGRVVVLFDGSIYNVDPETVPRAAPSLPPLPLPLYERNERCDEKKTKKMLLKVTLWLPLRV